MKNILLLFLFVFSTTAAAVPPYLAIRVGENLSFTGASCVQIAKAALENNGFEKVVQYKNSTSLFAAYRNRQPYHYKAVVKCLSDSQVIVILVAADSAREAKKKAGELLNKIVQHPNIKRSQTQRSQKTEEEEELVILEEEEHQGDLEKETKENAAVSSQDTLLNRKSCLNRAEKSIRDSGFYRQVHFDDDSVSGRNAQKYSGSVTCLISESEVIFQVTGGQRNTRNQLLNQLQKNF